MKNIRNDNDIKNTIVITGDDKLSDEQKLSDIKKDDDISGKINYESSCSCSVPQNYDRHLAIRDVNTNDNNCKNILNDYKTSIITSITSSRNDNYDINRNDRYSIDSNPNIPNTDIQNMNINHNDLKDIIQMNPPLSAINGSNVSIEQTEIDRIQLINQSISYSGTLRFKSTLPLATYTPTHIINSNESTILNNEDDIGPSRNVTWLNRFIVLRSGFLSFYGNSEDLYDDEKEPIHEVCLANILVVESSSDDKFIKRNMNIQIIGDIKKNENYYHIDQDRVNKMDDHNHKLNEQNSIISQNISNEGDLTVNSRLENPLQSIDSKYGSVCDSKNGSTCVNSVLVDHEFIPEYFDKYDEKYSRNHEPNCDEIYIDCVFDIHARVQTGGDPSGVKVFTLCSVSTESAKLWMEEICKAVGFLELLAADGGGFVSVINNSALLQREGLKLKLFGKFYDSFKVMSSEKMLGKVPNIVTDDRKIQHNGAGRGRGRGRGFLSNSSKNRKNIEIVFENEKLKNEKNENENIHNFIETSIDQNLCSENDDFHENLPSESLSIRECSVEDLGHSSVHVEYDEKRYHIFIYINKYIY